MSCSFEPVIDTFTFAGKQFKVCRTYPDKASILHAVLGSTSQGCYFSKTAREKYIAELKQKTGFIPVQAALQGTLKAYFAHVESKAKSIHTSNATKIFQTAISGKESDKKSIQPEKHVEGYLRACLDKEYCFTEIDMPLISAVFNGLVA